VKLDQSVCTGTGATSGIGAATARQLSQLGARAVLAAATVVSAVYLPWPPSSSIRTCGPASSR